MASRGHRTMASRRMRFSSVGDANGSSHAIEQPRGNGVEIEERKQTPKTHKHTPPRSAARRVGARKGRRRKPPVRRPQERRVAGPRPRDRVAQRVQRLGRRDARVLVELLVVGRVLGVQRLGDGSDGNLVDGERIGDGERVGVRGLVVGKVDAPFRRRFVGRRRPRRRLGRGRALLNWRGWRRLRAAAKREKDSVEHTDASGDSGASRCLCAGIGAVRTSCPRGTALGDTPDLPKTRGSVAPPRWPRRAAGRRTRRTAPGPRTSGGVGGRTRRGTPRPRVPVLPRRA